MLNLRSLVVGSLAILLLGCHGKETSTAVSPAVSGSASEELVTDPRERLYEQTRAGNFQIEASLNSLEAALKRTRAIRAHATDPEIKTRLGDVEHAVDVTGRAMGEHYGEAPTKQEVTAQQSAFETERQKTIADANDSIHDLQESRDEVSRLETAAGGSRDDLEELGRLLDVAMDDLRAVIEALGGREDVSQDKPLP